jgi:hypothetical protein
MLRRNTAIFTKVIRELGLQSDEVEIKTKASELQREVDRKIDAKLMTHWPSCKPVLCTHIACEMYIFCLIIFILFLNKKSKKKN